MLHYIAEPGEILANVTIGGGKIYGIALINSICVCAVDPFIFISGYFMWKANVISIKKPVQLLTEVIIFQEITSLISVFSRQTSIKSCVGALLPKNDFVTLYVALYLICPLVNKLIMDLSEDQYGTWIAVLVLIFSVEPVAVDILERLLGRSVMGISIIGVLGA